MLFLDELTTAPPAVQAAMLRVVLERAVGDLVLPEGVRIVAAANPPGIAADGWELSAPLANRLVHLDWQIEAAAVAEGFAHGFAVADAASVAAPTSGQIATAKAQLGAFLRIRPELVLAVPDSPERAGRSWPSPRSWEMAARSLAAGVANASDEATIAALVIGAVGEAAGFEALSWLRTLDLPDPESVLNDPHAPLPDRPDHLHALLGAVVAHVHADASESAWERAWDVIARVAKTTPDVAATSARALAGQRPAGANLPTALGGQRPHPQHPQLLAVLLAEALPEEAGGRPGSGRRRLPRQAIRFRGPRCPDWRTGAALPAGAPSGAARRRLGRRHRQATSIPTR